MKNLILSALIFGLVSCGPEPKDGANGDRGTPGARGDTGSSGKNSLIALVNIAPSCLNGGIIVLTGLDENSNSILDASEVLVSKAVCNGIDGATGTNGTNGHNALVDIVGQSDGGGASCTNGGLSILSGTDLNDNGELEVIEVSKSKDVCNGTNGVNGTNAASTPFTPIGLENPCGDAPGIYDEIFIRMNNGKLIASFSDNAQGKNTRFSELVPGNYVTTDGDDCSFTVNASGQIINESKHY